MTEQKQAKAVYNKRYYQQHKEYFKRYGKDNREQRNKNNRNYRARITNLRKTNESQDKLRQYYREYRNKLKRKVIEKFSQGTMRCKSCGESRLVCLTIDHINGYGKKHSKMRGTQFYGWLLKNGTLKEFQVLCMNCQWVKREVNRELYMRD